MFLGKYKIYDFINKEWLSPAHYCINQHGDIMTTKGIVILGNQDDYGKVFSTEMPDKNGQEIYSGHILSFKGETNPKWWRIVRFDREKAGFLLGDSYLGQFDLTEYEIIGNIYENKDLVQELEEYQKCKK